MPSLTWIEAHDIGDNYLRPNGFRLSFHNIPKVSYLCQSANIPGLMVGNPTQPTPFIDLPIAGEKMNREDLVVKFLVDSDLKNYVSIYNWIVGYSFPDDRDQFIDLRSSGIHNVTTRAHTPLNEESGIYSDATLTILTAKNNANVMIYYHDLLPVSLSGLPFDAAVGEYDYMTASATFKYKSYNIETVI